MKFDDWSGLMWQLLTIGLICAAAAVGIAWVWAPKRVDGYYLSRGGGGTGMVCVYAHWTWHLDEQAFCTDRYADALEFASKANAAVK